MWQARARALAAPSFAPRLAEELADVADARAKSLDSIPMPGYTHMQRAMPTTVGRWLGAYVAGWRDVEPMLTAAEKAPTRDAFDGGAVDAGRCIGLGYVFLLAGSSRQCARQCAVGPDRPIMQHPNMVKARSRCTDRQ